jgi:hypothetical protein
LSFPPPTNQPVAITKKEGGGGEGRGEAFHLLYNNNNSSNQQKESISRVAQPFVPKSNTYQQSRDRDREQQRRRRRRNKGNWRGWKGESNGNWMENGRNSKGGKPEKEKGKSYSAAAAVGL